VSPEARKAFLNMVFELNASKLGYADLPPEVIDIILVLEGPDPLDLAAKPDSALVDEDMFLTPLATEAIEIMFDRYAVTKKVITRTRWANFIGDTQGALGWNVPATLEADIKILMGTRGSICLDGFTQVYQKAASTLSLKAMRSDFIAQNIVRYAGTAESPIPL